MPLLFDMKAYCEHRDLQRDKIHELTRREKELLHKIEAQLGPCILWPTRFTESFLSYHLGYDERFQLTLFLLGNRCPPVLFVEWMISRGMLRDKSARDNVTILIKDHKSGKLEQQGRSTYIMHTTEDKPPCLRKHKWDGVGDPTNDKTRVIETPTFAYDWQHQHYWDQALEMLAAPPLTLLLKRSVTWADEKQAQKARSA
jgi:hypothetical protein